MTSAETFCLPDLGVFYSTAYVGERNQADLVLHAAAR